MANEQSGTEPAPAEFRCAMGRWDDVMTVRPVGNYGMMFVFSEDLSVILDRADQRRLRDLLNARLGEAGK